jgi:Phage integrase family
MIPMNSILRETLAAIRQEATADGQVFSINDVKRLFVYACVKARIADFRFHDLRRHTAATRLADRRADAFQITAILGHATIQMSARYTHATGHGLRRAMESLTANGRELRETSPTIFPEVGFGQSEANVQTLESIRLASWNLERATGFEPATLSLGSWCATVAPHPLTKKIAGFKKAEKNLPLFFTPRQ